MLRYGKPVAEKIEQNVKQWVADNEIQWRYVAAIMIGEDHPGSAYVQRKKSFAQRVGLDVKIFGDENKEWTEVDILQVIEKCNQDDECVGVIVQLPLPEYLHDAKQNILDAIDPHKDIDALGSWHQEKKLLLPATPLAVLQMIGHYEYNVQGKNIAMIGESNLIGKPLAFALEYKGALVKTFNIESDQEEMKKFCRDEADLIISATGHIHLVDESFVRGDNSQVIIDVGRGYKDNKPVGDVQWENLEDKVAAITPVPGGVGPVTVASLFANLMHAKKIADRELI